MSGQYAMLKHVSSSSQANFSFRVILAQRGKRGWMSFGERSGTFLSFPGSLKRSGLHVELGFPLLLAKKQVSLAGACKTHPVGNPRVGKEPGFFTTIWGAGGQVLSTARIRMAILPLPQRTPPAIPSFSAVACLLTFPSLPCVFC